MLLVVTLLFRSKPEFSARSHVIDAVSLYVDASVQLPLAKACKFGSLTLLNRIWDCKLDLEAKANASWSIRGLLRSEPWYQSFQANASLVEAVKRRDLDIVRWIFAHFPEFWVLEDAVEEAAAAGDMEILRYLLEKDINSAGSEVSDDASEPYHVICWGSRDMARAAAAGHADVVAWLQTTEEQDQRDGVATMKAAVTSGDIQFVELVQRITRIPPPQCTVGAASRGHLQLLQWLDDQFCMDTGTLLKAAENGHLNVVRWLIEQDWSNEDLEREDEADQWYDWDRRNSDISHPTHATSVGGEASLAIHAAVVNGHLEVAKYLHARVDTPLDEEDEKLESRRLNKTIKKLKRRLGENDEAMETVSGTTMLMAARNGFIDVVQWLYTEFHIDPTIDLFGGAEYGKEKEFTAMDFAAINGHLEILQLHAFDGGGRQDLHLGW
ncbi:hypothetical protein KRP22_007584 [Phytophthora ramorum]|nr:putative ankyrin repeat protein R840 [Phytophthora ramorum]